MKGVTSGTLYAEAKETSLSPRIGTYEIVITDETGATVALFQGMAYRKKETLASFVAAREEREKAVLESGKDA